MFWVFPVVARIELEGVEVFLLLLVFLGLVEDAVGTATGVEAAAVGEGKE
jgi:hypothetical protein